MRITKTDKKHLRKEPAERVGFLGRHPGLLGKRRILWLPLLLLIGLGLYFYLTHGWLITYGRVIAKEINISTTSVARISDIHVALGDRVEAGEILVSLSQQSDNADVYRNQAALRRTRIQLEGLVSRGIAPATRAGLTWAEQQLEQQRLKLKTVEASFWRKVKARDNARQELESKKSLAALDGITSQELKQAETITSDIEGQVNVARGLLREQEAAVKRAEYGVAQAEKNLRFAESKLESDIALQKLEIERLEQVIADSEVIFAEQDLVAPVAGTVTWVTKHAGEVVDHNDVILNVTADAPRWVNAYIYAGDWHKIQTGGRAVVQIGETKDDWMEGCIFMSFPTQRPIMEELPVGQRVARSPRQLDDDIHPVVIRFDRPIPMDYPTAAVVDVKLEKRSARAAVGCRNSPSENTPAD